LCRIHHFRHFVTSACLDQQDIRLCLFGQPRGYYGACRPGPADNEIIVLKSLVAVAPRGRHVRILKKKVVGNH